MSSCTPAGEADRDAEEDEHDVADVAERGAEAQDRHDAREAEGQGEAVADDQDDPGDDDRQDDERLHDGLVVPRRPLGATM